MRGRQLFSCAHHVKGVSCSWQPGGADVSLPWQQVLIADWSKSADFNLKVKVFFFCDGRQDKNSQKPLPHLVWTCASPRPAWRWQCDVISDCAPSRLWFLLVPFGSKLTVIPSLWRKRKLIQFNWISHWRVKPGTTKISLVLFLLLVGWASQRPVILPSAVQRGRSTGSAGGGAEFNAPRTRQRSVESHCLFFCLSEMKWVKFVLWLPENQIQQLTRVASSWLDLHCKPAKPFTLWPPCRKKITILEA